MRSIMNTNIFDYFTWRGDLTFQASPFNEIDGVILARFSYLPFEYCMSNHSSQRITDVSNPPFTIRSSLSILLLRPDIHNLVLQKEDMDLMTCLIKSKRFQNLEIYNYINKIEPENETQFSAITIRIDEHTQFVSYRGTDNTLVGWKEDFNMGFVCPVPAQKSAVNYLESLASASNTPASPISVGSDPSNALLDNALPNNNLPDNALLDDTFHDNILPDDQRYILGGHSKGGNLAVYASAFCSDTIRDRIETVYNYDGPGFDSKILEDDNFICICDRIKTFIPQTSIVGMLLEHEEEYTIVHSNQIGLLQHDVYSWDVIGTSFVYPDTVDKSSKRVDKTLKLWITDMNYEQREILIDTLFDVMSETNASTLKDLTDNWISNAGIILKALHNLDDENREVIHKALMLLLKSAAG